MLRYYVLCRDIVAKLGPEVVSRTPLQPIPNPDIKASQLLSFEATEQRRIPDISTEEGFCEIRASHGALGRFPGREVMGIMKAYMHTCSSSV